MNSRRLLHPSKFRIQMPEEQIARFCERWHVAELALFGSVLREDFRAGSDINVLVSFDADSHYGLFDVATMEAELKDLFNRDVMVLTRRGVELSSNPLRRREILGSAQVVYARS